MAITIRRTGLTLKIIISFLLVTTIILIILKPGRYASSADDIPNSTSSPQVTPVMSTNYDPCSGHGGANCSLFSFEAPVTCNDGTINDFFPFYAVQQCQKAVEDMSQEQFDFMANSGCYPPSEITCTNEQSYKNLSQTLTTSGLISSELGKNELINCRQEIKSYQIKNAGYKQCLLDNNRSGFVYLGKVGLPLLKSVFCPIFYGDRASYDLDADLCLCDMGYFVSNVSETGLSNGQCMDASLICQSKYGSNAYAKSGNCSCNKGYQFNDARTQCITKRQASVSSSPTPAISPRNPVQTFPKVIATPFANLPELTTTPKLRSAPINLPRPQPVREPRALNTNPNIIIKFFNVVLSGIKNIFNLP